MEHWILTNKWDQNITYKAVKFVEEFNSKETNHNTKITNWTLSLLTGYSGVAIICALLLIFAVCSIDSKTGNHRQKRLLMLPWLCFDFLTISVITLTFIAWAFLSFFVHVLLAILFPVIAGAVLGLYIYLWRNVRDVFEIYGDEEMKIGGKLIHINTSGGGGGGLHYGNSKMYRKLPAAASSPPHSVNNHPSIMSASRHIAVT